VRTRGEKRYDEAKESAQAQAVIESVTGPPTLMEALGPAPPADAAPLLPRPGQPLAFLTEDEYELSELIYDESLTGLEVSLQTFVALCMLLAKHGAKPTRRWLVAHLQPASRMHTIRLDAVGERVAGQGAWSLPQASEGLNFSQGHWPWNRTQTHSTWRPEKFGRDISRTYTKRPW
jgi:hypothetical protein